MFHAQNRTVGRATLFRKDGGADEGGRQRTAVGIIIATEGTAEK